MSIRTEKIAIANLEIDVVRKNIKNMHLAVYPPTGRIRLSAPERTDAEVVRLFAISKLGWIKKHVKNFKEQPRESKRLYVSGESHNFMGQRYLLKVVEHEGYSKVTLNGTKQLLMKVKKGATAEEKADVLKEWYRRELKQILPELISKWEKAIGVKADDWGVKQMRTKWGACNVDEKRIWLNLELAKKPLICIEYVIVHELVHLLERHHNDKFVKHLDTFMPKWRMHRNELNSLPIGFWEL